MCWTSRSPRSGDCSTGSRAKVGWNAAPTRADRRAKRVYLTGNVQVMMRTLRHLAADLRAQALDGLDEPEREQLLEALRVVKGNLLRLNGNGSLDATGRQREGTGAGRGTHPGLSAHQLPACVGAGWSGRSSW